MRDESVRDYAGAEGDAGRFHVRTVKRKVLLGMLASLTVLPRLGSEAAAAQPPPQGMRGSWTWRGGDAQDAVLVLTFPFPDNAEQHDKRVSTTSISTTLTSLGVTDAASGAVRFSLVRDAGTFRCSGVLDGASASGDVVFEKSSAFERSIEGQGFDALTNRDLLGFALFDVDTPFLTALRPAFPDASPRDFVELRVMTVSSAYALAVKRFAPAMQVKDIVALAMFKVPLDDVERLERIGDGKVSANDLVSLKFAGVDAPYVDDLAAAGYSKLTIDDYQRLRFAKIDGAYLKRIGAADKQLTVDQLLRLKFAE